VSLADRKSIYPFIHNLTSFLQSFVEQVDKAHLKQQLVELQSWVMLQKSLQECENMLKIEWG